MGEETEAAVRRALAAFASSDFEGMVEACDPSVEWKPLEELKAVRGREPVWEALSRWLEPWDVHEIALGELISVGDSAAVGVHIRARGKASGVELEDVCWQLWQVRKGRVVRMREIGFGNRGEALEALGLTAETEPTP